MLVKGAPGNDKIIIVTLSVLRTECSAFLYFLGTYIAQVIEIFIRQCFILPTQYHYCWWPGNTRSRPIKNMQGIDHAALSAFCKEIYFNHMCLSVDKCYNMQIYIYASPNHLEDYW